MKKKMGEWFRTTRESKTGMPAKSAAVQCVDGGFGREDEKGEIERDENRRGEGVYPSVRGRHSVDGGRGGKMKSTMERLEKYFDKKRLTLNVGKTKVIRFRRKRRKMRKTELK